MDLVREVVVMALAPAVKPPPEPGLPPATSRCEVEVLENVFELETRRVAWEELAGDPVEPNVFYEPWALLPAIAAFGGTSRLRFVLVYRQPKGPPRKARRPLLIGFFPLEIVPPSRRIPVASLALWRHRHCYLTAPLLRRGYGAEALAAFFDLLAQRRLAPGPLSMKKVPGEGPTSRLLSDELERRGWLFDVERRYTRAVLRPGGADAERYLCAAMPGKRRKELRRLRRRLAEHGHLEVAVLEGGDDVGRWIDRFADLEAGGWKGERGDSFRGDPSAMAFLGALVVSGHREGRLMMTALELDGRPIAYKLNLVSGDGAFAFKIAYDESYRRYSPGVHLEIDAVDRLCRHPRLRWMDSCAAAEHPMIDGLWAERRAVEQLTISPGRIADTVLSLRAIFRLGKRAIGGRR